MNRTSRPLVPAVLIVLAASAGAQPIQAAWPDGLGGAGPFLRTSIGRYTYDAIPDACVLKGNEAVLAYGPGVYAAYAVVATGVNDAATLRRTGGDPVDAILTAGDGGLIAHTLRTTGDAFVVDVLDPAWTTVVRLRSANTDGTGGHDVCGLDTDGVTIHRRASPAPGALPDVWVEPIVAPNPVGDFDLVQWDHDPAAELACLTTIGLEVLDDDGTPLFAETGAPPGGVLTAFRQENRTTDRLAWLTDAGPGSNAVLVVCDASGTEVVQAIAPIGPVGVAAADLNGDGNDDLLISGTASHHVMLVFNQAETPGATETFTWGPGDFALLPVTTSPADPAPLAAATPAPLDLDGDGDIDVLFPVESTPELVRIENPTVDASALRPGVTLLEYEDLGSVGGGGGGEGGGGAGGGGGGHSQGYSQWIDGTGEDEIEISGLGLLHLTVEESPDLPAAATHLQLVVWRAEEYGASVAPVAIQKTEVALPADPTGWPMTVSIEIDEPDFPFPAVHYVELRAIDDGASSGVPAAFPALLAAFTVEEATADQLVLEKPDALVHGAILYSETDPDDSTPHSSLQIGALVEVPDVDDYVIGAVPVPEEEDEPSEG